MSGTTTGLDELRACIESTAPLELKGMGLLREQPRLIAGLASVPRAQIVEAVIEAIAYTERCAAAAQGLATLTPISLIDTVVWEFGL